MALNKNQLSKVGNLYSVTGAAASRQPPAASRQI